MTGQQSSLKAPVGADGWRVAGICLVLAAITFAVFGQTAEFGFINVDDNVYVYENPLVAGGLSMKGLAWVFTHADCSLYHPLTMLSLMWDYQFHGLHAGGYHFTNVLFHAVSAILLFLVLRQMTGTLWRCAFVAAVFAIHPLRAESVAWVAERKDVLGAFFFLLTLGAYVRYVRKPNSLARYLMVAGGFVLALLSKPTVVTLPFVLLLLDYWPLRRFEQPRKLSRLILEKIPLLALAGAACITTVLTAGKGIAAQAHVSMTSRLGNALVSYAVYLRQMIWPAGLAAFYPQPEKGYPIWLTILCFLMLALITGGVVVFGRKRGWLLAGWFWYLGMLTPMIGFVQAGEFAHADRMTYLPQIGLYLLLTWTVAELSSGCSCRRVTLGGMAAISLVALIFCARNQTAYWRDSESLWIHTLACTTNNCVAHLNLGAARLEKGRTDDAITQFKDALQIKSDYEAAHLYLGNALQKKGRADEALSQYQTAAQLRPDFVEAQHNLGTAFLQAGRVDEAIVQYQAALLLKPDSADIQYNLGSIFLQKGKVDEAITHYQAAVDIKPDYAEAHYRLGNAFREKGSLTDAATQYQAAVQIKPDYEVAHVGLAIAMLQLGRVDEAINYCQKALQLKTNDADAHYNLGNALLQKGGIDEAIAHFQQALQINPSFVDAHVNLGNVLLQNGKVDEAITHFQKALQIKPNNGSAENNLGNAFLQQGSVGEAISHYEKALRLDPANPSILNNLAGNLATCPDPSLRNGAKAVELAVQANTLTGGENSIILHTLAAALAEAGRFPEAVETAQHALRLAEAQSNTRLAGALQSEIKLYQAGRPFHSPEH